MEVLRLEKLCKYYTSQTSVVRGLDNISLSFSTGEMVAITGESGSGKSTIARVLGGMLSYESGEMYVYGNPTSHYDRSDWEIYRRDMIAYISQDYGVLGGSTVKENVESALLLSGVSAEETALRTKEILAEVGLTEFHKRRASKLSSGQKQRLSIARALAKPSKILIADEPTGNLDSENSAKIIELLKKASEDRLVILITHDFDEAKDAATRRIILADGVVVTDAALDAPLSATASESGVQDKKGGKKALSFYVAMLTVRSRPVFSAIMCLLMVLTAFLTFAFSGTFIANIDDTFTRIYDPNVFRNGDTERIIVMRSDGEDMTDDDYSSMLSVKYVEDIEAWGYVNDMNYYYRPETDYHIYRDIINGENYHSVTNPDDFHVAESVEFYEKGLFFRTLPKTNENIIVNGRAAKEFGEVVSADPSYKIGDTVKVYFRHRNNWSVSAFLCFDFTVVGESEYGDGLYFSDKLAATLDLSFDHGDRGEAPMPLVFVPYRKGDYDLEIDALLDDEVCVSENFQYIFVGHNLKPGVRIYIGDAPSEDGPEFVTIRDIYDSSLSNVVLVNDNVYEKRTDFSPSDQVSVFISDYAYADRVIDALEDKGYIALSPFRMGSAKTDPTLVKERESTLRISAIVLFFVLVLQIILLRVMFSSLNEHFRLLSNIGLTEKCAGRALSIILSLYLAVGEIFGISLILILDKFGVERIHDIFKFVNVFASAILIVIHIISVIAVLPLLKKVLRRAVFPGEKRHEDLDISGMEEA